MRVRRKRIDRFVEDLFMRCRVTQPPVPVEDIAHALGLEIERHKFDEEEFSGILVREGKRAVIGVNSSHHMNRQRFTIAHELGHFLLHEGDRVFIDRNYNVSFRSSVSSLGTDVEEIEANTFASALLVPERFLLKDPDAADVDMEDEETIKRLARQYRVSPQAMTFRLNNRSP